MTIVAQRPGAAYPASRAVAASAEAFFQRHLAEAVEAGETELATAPSAETIEAIIDAAFWASLRREEGYPPKISLAFLSPHQTPQPLMLARRIPLGAQSLTRLAAAVERPGIHLGVWRDGDDLYVWGTTHTVPPFGFVLEVVRPGLLVIKCRRGHVSGKFANVAVLEGDQVKLVDQGGSALIECPEVIRTLLGLDTIAPQMSVNVIVELAVSMRSHARGGTLLIVPRGSTAWRESIARPIAYPVSPSFTGLTELMRQTPDEGDRREWEDALRHSIDAIASLTAVDGATVIDDQYEVFAFGAKIARRDGGPSVEHVIMSEPVEDAIANILDPPQLGGTRHLSAAQFVMDQPDAVALVASQDGPFTVFTWSPFEKQVRAYRVESLLL